MNEYVILLVIIILCLLAGGMNDSEYYDQSFEDWQKEFDLKG